ncbi:MAG: hypothetical protein N2449_09635 [Bacteroidales bacterium]|nr:hypothetical protein [Bacteroidales bacterium]
MRAWYYIICCLLVVSCEEYEYEKPLTPICKASIDTNVIGLWVFESYKTYNNFTLDIDSHLLMILPYNKHEYIIVLRNEKKASNDLPLLYKGHISKIGNYTFANIRWIGDKNDVPYIYYAFTIQNDSLYYWGYVKNKLPQVFQAKKFFVKHYNDTNYISAIRKYKRFRLLNKPLLLH